MLLHKIFEGEFGLDSPFARVEEMRLFLIPISRLSDPTYCLMSVRKEEWPSVLR